MRTKLARAFVFMFAGLVVFNAIMGFLMSRHVCPAVTSAFIVIAVGMPVVLTFLAGLVWDDPSLQESASWMCWLWVILPAAMLVVVVAGLIIDPPDIADAWYVLGGVIVWNLLLPIGRLIGRQIWRTTQDV